MRFFSKHIKIIFLVLTIISLILGLLYKNGSGKECSRAEFLMDTACTITAYGKDADKAVNAAFDEVARIHSLTDFYDLSSDVSRINSAKRGEAVSVDAAITDILATALEICEASDGAFDVTIAPLSQLWSFGNRHTPPRESLISKARERVSFKNITIDTQKYTITKKFDDTQIDLGGASKGYAADCAAEVMKKYRISGAIIDLGGSVKCLGNNPKTFDRQWRIGVQIPFSPTGEYGRVIDISDGSVITSGTYQRNFEYDGKLYHHILNPHTGYPDDKSYNSVTIVADSALLADCLSTACYVLGEEMGTALAEKYNAQILFQ